MIKTEQIHRNEEENEEEDEEEVEEETENNFDRINFDRSITDLVRSDQIYNRIKTYLNEAPLNIKKDDYCYVKIVKNHLEIGRAKIVLDE